MWGLDWLSFVGFLILPAFTLGVENVICPQPWPGAGTRRGEESCSCQTGESFGLRVKCSLLTNWPLTTPHNTGELLLGGTRANATLFSLALGSFAPNLKVFVCKDCGITDIERMAFFGLNNIRKLDLQENSIRTIRPFAFSGLANLQELNLKSCGIVTIEENAFMGLVDINIFDLSKNPIYTIKRNAFRNVSRIHQMNLAQIKMERLSGYTLKGLKDIGLLSFMFSEIRTLEAYALFGINNISTISFHSSQLQRVMPYAFIGIGKVGSIRMKSTEVSSLQCESLEGLDCVRSVDWSDSPLRCDCNIQWMLEHSVNISRDITKGLQCASPYHLKGRSPLDLDDSDLGCNDEERYMGCASMDTRVPRVRALERYIADVYERPQSDAYSMSCNLGLALFSTWLAYYFAIH